MGIEVVGRLELDMARDVVCVLKNVAKFANILVRIHVEAEDK